MSENKKPHRQFLPKTVKKEYENLKSWRAFYKYLGTPNLVQLEVVEKQLDKFRQKYNIQVLQKNN